MSIYLFAKLKFKEDLIYYVHRNVRSGLTDIL